jgi:hypothetical protein
MQSQSNRKKRKSLFIPMFHYPFLPLESLARIIILLMKLNALLPKRSVTLFRQSLSFKTLNLKLNKFIKPPEMAKKQKTSTIRLTVYRQLLHLLNLKTKLLLQLTPIKNGIVTGMWRGTPRA